MTSRQIRQEWSASPGAFFPIKEILKHIPIKTTPDRLRRWASRGRLTRRGQRIHLETYWCGNLCTTVAAVARFQARLNGETL